MSAPTPPLVDTPADLAAVAHDQDPAEALRAAQEGAVAASRSSYEAARAAGSSHAEILEAYQASVQLYEEALGYLSHAEILELAASGVTVHDYVLLRHYRATDTQARALIAAGFAGCWQLLPRRDGTAREEVVVAALEKVAARGVPLASAAELVSGLGRAWEESLEDLVSASLALHHAAGDHADDCRPAPGRRLLPRATVRVRLTG